ncbi:MAG: Pr6Pr family membrane protein [Clostridia bacterium]|nr:Pr6Pr family membrane protein [Clostridia bacterium]
MNGKKGIIYLKYLICILILISVFPRMVIGDGGINWNRLTYYTIQTNLIMAIYWFLAAQKPKRLQEQSFEVFRLMSAAAITITGSMYFLYLHANYMVTLNGLLETGNLTPFLYYYDLSNTYLNHLIVPVAAIADYLFVRPHSELKKQHIFYPIVIPFTYFIFHSIRGLLSSYYTYSFIDPNKMGGWVNVFLMVGVLTVFTVVMSLILFLFILRRGKSEPLNNKVDFNID